MPKMNKCTSCGKVFEDVYMIRICNDCELLRAKKDYMDLLSQHQKLKAENKKLKQSKSYWQGRFKGREAAISYSHSRYDLIRTVLLEAVEYLDEGAKRKAINSINTSSTLHKKMKALAEGKS